MCLQFYNSAVGIHTGGGGHLPIFLVRMCGWSPQTPTHSYTRPSEKHDPFIYFPYRKLTPFIYYFWKLTPFIYHYSNFTHSYTFWVKKIPHWYTFDVKMIPIHILGGLKSIPHSSRTSVYTFIMEVTPPWVYIYRYIKKNIGAVIRVYYIGQNLRNNEYYLL